MYTLMVTSHMTTVQKLLHSVFSPPRPTRKLEDPHSEDEDNNKNSAETGISSAANRQDELRGVKEDRCQFTFSDGRQCRNQPSRLCVHHSSRKEREGRVNGFPDFPPRRNVYQQDELSPLRDVGLEALCGDLTTSTNINRALSQVFLLMAQGRISQKQAVAFGYISQLLLQTVPGIRSEYVSVHGYRDWENRLKTSLIPNTDPDPEPSSGGENKQPTTEAADHPAKMVVPSEQRERGAASPDYANLLCRSRDMMAGKYDTTPEGRREANALALELELMNPAPAKPRKDFFSRTVALVRRLRDSRRERHAVRESPLSRGPEEGQEQVRAGNKQISTGVVERQKGAPITPFLPHEKVPPTPSVAAFEAAAKAAIPAASPPSPPDSNAPSDRSPKARPKQEMPVPGITLARTGHTTAWYAPASWSGPRPDPFPSRKERLRRSLQTMGNRGASTKCRTAPSGGSPCNSRTMNTCAELLGGCRSKQLMI